VLRVVLTVGARVLRRIRFELHFVGVLRYEGKPGACEAL
jgi:hypothetical protein